MPSLGVSSLWPRIKAQSSALFEFAYFRVLFVFLRKSNFKTMIWSSTVCTLWEKLVICTSQTLLGCLLPFVYSTAMFLILKMRSPFEDDPTEQIHNSIFSQCIRENKKKV